MLKTQPLAVATAALLVGFAPAAASAATSAAPTGVTRVSVAANGVQANGMSIGAALSGDGSRVVFASGADNLVSGDTNRAPDIFLDDRRGGGLTRISVANDGAQVRYRSEGASAPAISRDGRYIAYLADARDLVPADEDAYWTQAYLYDTSTKTTVRVSQAADGTAANRDVEDVTISADGRYVAYDTPADNLASGDTDPYADIMVYDRTTGTTERLSLGRDGQSASFGAESPALSANGRYVAFTSFSDNLVAGDTNASEDVFVHDRRSHTTTRVSVASDGTQGDWRSFTPSISADGRYVAFSTWAANLVPGDSNESADVLLHDRNTGKTTLVSAVGGMAANGASDAAHISADGRSVSFMSSATNLSPADVDKTFDIYRRDVSTATTDLVTVNATGVKGNGPSWIDGVSVDGRTVLFSSDASNLVENDTNAQPDVFLTTF